MNRATLLTGWTFLRILRLGMGILFAIQAIQFREALAGFVSVFFLFQAITNTGCCGASGCEAPAFEARKKEGIDDVVFEEVKAKE
jgi:hypothetical protein